MSDFWQANRPRNVAPGRSGEPRADQCLQRGDIDAYDLPELNEVDGGGNPCRDWPRAWPMIRGQDDNGQPPTSEILLVSDILVTGEEHIEPRLLRRIKQRAVFQSLPSQFIRPGYLMS